MRLRKVATSKNIRLGLMCIWLSMVRKIELQDWVRTELENLNAVRSLPAARIKLSPTSRCRVMSFSQTLPGICGASGNPNRELEAEK